MCNEVASVGNSCALEAINTNLDHPEETKTINLWAWTANLSSIPKSVWLTFTGRARDVRLESVTVFKTPPGHWQRSVKHCIILHLEEIQDYTLSSVNLDDRRSCTPLPGISAASTGRRRHEEQRNVQQHHVHPRALTNRDLAGATPRGRKSGSRTGRTTIDADVPTTTTTPSGTSSAGARRTMTTKTTMGAVTALAAPTTHASTREWAPTVSGSARPGAGRTAAEAGVADDSTRTSSPTSGASTSASSTLGAATAPRRARMTGHRSPSLGPLHDRAAIKLQFLLANRASNMKEAARNYLCRNDGPELPTIFNDYGTKAAALATRIALPHEGDEA